MLCSNIQGHCWAGITTDAQTRVDRKVLVGGVATSVVRVRHGHGHGKHGCKRGKGRHDDDDETVATVLNDCGVEWSAVVSCVVSYY